MIALYEHNLSPMRWRVPRDSSKILLVSINTETSIAPTVHHKSMTRCDLRLRHDDSISDIFDSAQNNSVILFTVGSCARLRRLSDRR